MLILKSQVNKFRVYYLYQPMTASDNVQDL